jgi:protein TonB
MSASPVQLLVSGLRLPLFGAAALLLNLLLFYFIHEMVTNEQFRPPEIENINLVDFIRFQQEQRPEEETIKEEELDEPPPPQEPPPPVDLPQPELEPPQPPVDVDMPVPELDVPLSMQGTPYIGDFMKSVKPAPIARKPATKPRAPEIATNLVPTMKIPPSYPPRALRSGIEGVVTVEFTIAGDGSVKDPVIVKASPPKIFDRAVLEAIRKWKFNPKMEDGKAVEQRARQDVRFSLK